MTEVQIQHLKQDIIVETELRGMPFRFYTTWGLFSSEKIDEGTHLLLKHVPVMENSKILDLGCGYGALGIPLAKIASKGDIHMVDKDFVAVGYARKNAKANMANHCKIYLSNGFEQIEAKDFDIIVSNLPAKVNKELFWIWLHDAKKHLKPGGSLYVVTISGLKEFMKRNLIDFFGNYEKLGQNKTYTVGMATNIAS